MRSLALVLVLAVSAAAQTPELPAAPAALARQGGGLLGSNLLNPNISVIGWFQGEAGNRYADPGKELSRPLDLKEAELAFQAMVDPYARADFFIAATREGFELEEGYIDWYHLPADFAVKVGKFRAGLGRFNRTHPAETAFADRPLVHERFFGEEGLAEAGASVSWQAPLDLALVTLDGQALNAPEAEAVPAFGRAQRRDLLYIGRASGYYDLTEALNTTLGLSYAHGPAGVEVDQVVGTTVTRASQLGGVDLTFRWKDPRRAIYRSAFWQTEAFWSRREGVDDSKVGAFGLFTHLEYQFARRWRAGARYDYTQSPTDRTRHEKGGLAYLTFTPSEFSLISLQGRRARRFDGTNETLGMLKVTFNIGPHGAHPF